MRSSARGSSSQTARRPTTRWTQVAQTTVFTTHTPVPAGNEIFGGDLVLRYVGDLAASAGLSHEQLLALGRSDDTDGFGLTPLALRLSAHRNGVSALHGEVARKMWQGLWPGAEPPIDAITNGVHLGTWLAPELARLLRSVGVRPDEPPAWANWKAAQDLDPDALWDLHGGLRRRLAEHAGLDPDRLTIGFARRFATYKRAGLLYDDLERLLALPVQVVVAGKAHPQDTPGKDVMQGIVELRPRRRPRSDRLPRELRHRPRPHDHPRLRHLAEHTAPALRGVGHERHEGGRERRAQPLRARRLVGRGV